MNIRRIKYKLSCKSLKNYQSKNQNEIDIFIKITAELFDKVNPIIDKELKEIEAKQLYWKLKKGKKVNRQDRKFLYKYLSIKKAYRFKVIENSKIYRRKESHMEPSFMVSMKKEFRQNLEMSNAILMMNIDKILGILKKAGLEIYSIQNIIDMNNDNEFINFVQLQNRTRSVDEIKNILKPYPELFDILKNNIYGHKFLKKKSFNNI